MKGPRRTSVIGFLRVDGVVISGILDGAGRLADNNIGMNISDVMDRRGAIGGEAVAAVGHKLCKHTALFVETVAVVRFFRDILGTGGSNLPFEVLPPTARARWLDMVAVDMVAV
jgi:hypothetical protein